jgi:hypothetical protein
LQRQPLTLMLSLTQPESGRDKQEGPEVHSCANAGATVEERRLSAAESAEDRAGLKARVKGHHSESSFSLRDFTEPAPPKKWGAHFSRTSREVGTTNAAASLLTFSPPATFRRNTDIPDSLATDFQQTKTTWVVLARDTQRWIRFAA